MSSPNRRNPLHQHPKISDIAVSRIGRLQTVADKPEKNRTPEYNREATPEKLEPLCLGAWWRFIITPALSSVCLLATSAASW